MKYKEINTELKSFDPEIYESIMLEKKREEESLELIASENFTSRAIMEAQGSILTNKYAEGYPSRRYYGGCSHIDRIENLAIARAKQIFGSEHVNVQPHSGSQANMAVYFSVLNPNDLIMGMNLSDGGHLTHGSPVNFSGKIFRSISYGVDQKSGLIDYQKIQIMAQEHRPQMIIAGASSYSRTIDFQKFSEIAQSIDAYLLADISHIAGLIVTDLHPTPVPHCDFVTTTTHKTLRGPRGGLILCRQKFAKVIDKMIFPGIQGGPAMHVIAGKAVCLKEAQSESFFSYQKQIIKNANILAQALIAKKLDLVSKGTDNHLMLINLQNKQCTGKTAEKLLEDVGITANKNTIPGETESPFVTSGLRIGVPSVTTRGMKEKEMIQIADLIAQTLDPALTVSKKTIIQNKVKKLCHQFPVYRENHD